MPWRLLTKINIHCSVGSLAEEHVFTERNSEWDSRAFTIAGISLGMKQEILAIESRRQRQPGLDTRPAMSAVVLRLAWWALAGQVVTYLGRHDVLILVVD